MLCYGSGPEQSKKNLDSVILFCYPSNGCSSPKSSKGVVQGNREFEGGGSRWQKSLLVSIYL